MLMLSISRTSPNQTATQMVESIVAVIVGLKFRESTTSTYSTIPFEEDSSLVMKAFLMSADDVGVSRLSVANSRSKR
jgi:hypothetical protein